MHMHLDAQVSFYPARKNCTHDFPILVHRGKITFCVQGQRAHFPTDLVHVRYQLAPGIVVKAVERIFGYFEKSAITDQNTEAPQKWTFCKQN